jgi:hypothetical protein
MTRSRYETKGSRILRQIEALEYYPRKRPKNLDNALNDYELSAQREATS